MSMSLPNAFKELDQWAIESIDTRQLTQRRGNIFDPRMSAADRAAVIDLIIQQFGDRAVPRAVIAQAVDMIIADRAAAMHSHVCVSGGVAQNCYADFRLSMSEAGASSMSRVPGFLSAPRSTKFASAAAKSSKIGRIECESGQAPQFPGEPPVWRYQGLGIGSTLYTTAMEHLDSTGSHDWRCIDGASTEFARAARWKLHCRSPYKWEYRTCPVCTAGEIEWVAATVADFDGVPHDRWRDAPKSFAE